ncbi:MAG: hypothetical protein KBA51_05210 [Kiritimatiellae bacterium]|nr:hypothetical protein [Kiritimatiellia bacterium]
MMSLDLPFPDARRLPRGAPAQARALVEAMTVAEAAVAKGQPADTALAEFFRARRHLGSRDRRVISNSVFAAFRWRGWVGSMRDCGPRILADAVRVESDVPLPPAVQLLAPEREPPNPPKAGEPSAPSSPPSPLAPAQYRAERTLGRACPVRSLLPDWFVEWSLGAGAPDGAPPEWMVRFIESTRVRPPLGLRVLGSAAERAAALLRAHGYEAWLREDLPGAVQVAGAPPYENLFRPAGIRAYVQDPASQRIVSACRAQPGQRWWDACAGGGGKTLGLLDAVGPGGSVWATDIRPASLRQLAMRAAALRLPAPILDLLDAASASPSGGPFDGILVDAPCTGSGTWARNPDAPWRMDLAQAQELVHRQQAILSRASESVRPGGRLVYATCSVVRPENDDQVTYFLRNHPEFHRDTSESIWPWDGPQNGSYYAALVRTA